MAHDGEKTNDGEKTHDGEDWRDHWRGMPEFVQEDLRSARQIIVHFRSDDDARKFAEIIGQRITPKQKSIWFPELVMRRKAHLRYLEADVSEDS